ncbi:MAG: nucleotidyltransferase family protein [Chloroflexota bacterium]
MDAMVAAGGVPEPGDPLYEYTQGQSKAMVDVAGKPMVQWVLDALSASKGVDRVVLVGLDAACGVACSKFLAFVPDQGGLLDNVLSGMKKVVELNPQAKYVLTVSSDVPAVTAEMIDWVINIALESDVDVVYNVIEQRVMEERFPGSRRSYTKLKDAVVCGGDVNVVSTRMITAELGIWEAITAARKNVFKQAALIGYDTLLLLLMRQVTLEGALKTVSKRLGIRGRAVICPYAEIGMDMDKPFQLEILRQDLSRQKVQ